MTDRPRFVLHGVPFDLEPGVLDEMAAVAVELRLMAPSAQENVVRLRRCLRALQIEQSFSAEDMDKLSVGEQGLLRGCIHAAYLHGLRGWP